MNGSIASAGNPGGAIAARRGGRPRNGAAIAGQAAATAPAADATPDEPLKFAVTGAIKDTYTLDYAWDIDETGVGVASWTLVSATMLKAMDGSYTLAAHGDGTEVTYELTVDVKVPMLGMLKRKAEKVIVDTALRDLKKRAEA